MFLVFLIVFYLPFISLSFQTSLIVRLECDSHLQGLVRMSHRQDFMSGVDASQFAEGTEQPLTGPAVELEFLLVVFRTRQNLRTSREKKKKKQE